MTTGLEQQGVYSQAVPQPMSYPAQAASYPAQAYPGQQQAYPNQQQAYPGQQPQTAYPATAGVQQQPQQAAYPQTVVVQPASVVMAVPVQQGKFDKGARYSKSCALEFLLYIIHEPLEK